VHGPLSLGNPRRSRRDVTAFARIKHARGQLADIVQIKIVHIKIARERACGFGARRQGSNPGFGFLQENRREAQRLPIDGRGTRARRGAPRVLRDRQTKHCATTSPPISPTRWRELRRFDAYLERNCRCPSRARHSGEGYSTCGSNS
jgi:hypothetical protein